MQKALYPLLVFLLAALLYIPPLRDLPFSSRGEAREALVVQAMIDQQNKILPRRNGETIPSKPPLFHWAALSSLAIGGGGSPTAPEPPSEMAIRLPSALASALAIALLFAFTLPRLGFPAAALATMVLATSVEWARSSSIARVDMVFALFVQCGMLALFQLIDDYRRSGKTSWKQLSLIGLLLACATLTKGPAGIAIPWAIALLYFVAVLPLRRLPLLPGVAAVGISVALAGVWYLAAYFQGGSEFLDVHLMRENLARVVGMDEYETGHEAPAYTILLLLLTGLLPWSIFLPAIGWASWKRRSILRTEEDSAVLFMLIWIAFFLVFFGATSSKRSVYLLPCYPACAYLMAWTLFTPGARQDAGRALGIAAWLSALITGALVVVLTLIGVLSVSYGTELPTESLVSLGVKLKPHVIAQIQLVFTTLQSLPIAAFGLVLSAGVAAFASVDLLRGRLLRGTFTFGAAATLLLVIINTVLFPPIARAISPKGFMARVVARVGDRPLFQFNNEDFHAATFYAGRVVPRIEPIPNLTKVRTSYILAPKGRLPEILGLDPSAKVLEESSAFDVYGRDRFILIELPAATDSATHGGEIGER